jgi:RNase P/RNase MRP subunit p30
MIDIVAAENLARARGIKRNAPAPLLKNFRMSKSAEAARSEARVKNILLHSSSYEFDDGVYIDLKKSGSAVVFGFCDILREHGFRRAIVLSKMRMALEGCRKRGCGAVVCTLAESEHELRSARELEAFMSVLGMNQHEKAHAEECAQKLAGGK